MIFPLRKVINFAASKFSKDVDEAYRQFFGSLPFSELKPQWEELFWEWLIFDFKVKNQFTFLEGYILGNPDNFDGDEIIKLKQVEKTQFYSQFEITEIKRGQWILAEDLHSGKIYKIYEKKGSEALSGPGVIPGRIARYENKWYLVGANSVFFPITYTQRAKKNMRLLKVGNFSPRDIVELLRAQEQRPAGSINIPTKRKLKIKQESLKKEYERIAKKFNITFFFDDLTDKIYKEDRGNVLDFWKRLEKEGLRLEVLIENTQLFQDIWNYFPHDCLNNLSPIEVFTKLKKKGDK